METDNPMFSSFMSALSRHSVNGSSSGSSSGTSQGQGQVLNSGPSTPIVPNLVTKFTNETNQWVEKTNAEIEQRKRNFLHEMNPMILMGISLTVVFILSILLLNGWKLCSSKAKGVLFAFLITLCLFGAQFLYYWNWIRIKN